MLSSSSPAPSRRAASTFSAGTFWSTNREISWIAAGITLIGLALKFSGNFRASTMRANATVASGRASAEVTRG